MNRKRFPLILVIVALFTLASCRDMTSSESSSLESLNTSEVTTSEETSVSIAAARSGEVNESFTVTGVVVAYNYTGQSTPYITGFWLADQTDSIYIYGEDVAKSVQPGNKVTVQGTKAYYIPQNDVGSATAINYKGMVQLTSPVIVGNDNKTDNEIPNEVISNLSVADINAIPLTEDITGKIYRTKAYYHVYDNVSYVNYEIEDTNLTDTLLAYTQSNGKDYAWTNEWNGKLVDIEFVVSIGKPSQNLWRICPINILGETTISDEEVVAGGAYRALLPIANSYNVDTVITMAKNDGKVAGLTIAYTSSSSQITITTDETNNYISIKSQILGEVSLVAEATYNGISVSKTKDFTIIAKPDIDTISLAEAKQESDGTIVTVEGVVAKLTYKSSMVKQGFFIADESGSMFVYNGTSTQGNLIDLEEGNKVVIQATVTHYVKDATNAAAEEYDGDFQLSEAEVLSIDRNVFAIPSTAYSTNSIEAIVSTRPSTNLTGNMYLVTCTVYKSSGQYGSYTFFGLDDSSVGLPLYSQNNANDFSWLEPYIGQQVQIIVGVQNLQLKSSGSYWRGCPIQIIVD